jgi:phage terminase large subunit-like protein
MLRVLANDPELRATRAAWEIGANKPYQLPDEEPWTTWLILAGRGAGKTRAGAEWIKWLAQSKDPGTGRPRTLALVAESYSDAREIMIEGPSGLLAIAGPRHRPAYAPSRRRIEWPSGAVAHCFSAEDPDGLRGFEFNAAWGDELCKWRYAEETWSNLQLALRIGSRPRQVMTTTPRPTKLLKGITAAPTTRINTAATYANARNLSAAFFSEILKRYEGTALGRQEIDGELIEGVEGALWSWRMIEAARASRAPQLERVVVAVDPPASSGPDADECGIIAAGLAGETGYVLADWSARGLSPRAWGQRAVAAFHEFGAGVVIVEANQGGEMAKAVLAQIDRGVPVTLVHATKSKWDRAQPVALKYEQGLVRHIGAFAALEDQMTSFTGSGPSPDRLDALVWALSALMLRQRSEPSVKLLA